MYNLVCNCSDILLKYATIYFLKKVKEVKKLNKSATLKNILVDEENQVSFVFYIPDTFSNNIPDDL